jgi:hypothetical protein
MATTLPDDEAANAATTGSTRVPAESERPTVTLGDVTTVLPTTAVEAALVAVGSGDAGLTHHDADAPIPVQASSVRISDELLLLADDELPVVLADAVFLEDAADPQQPDLLSHDTVPLPAAAVPATTSATSLVTTTDGVATIQLGPDNIMSVRHYNRHERPEYLCVILRNSPDYRNTLSNDPRQHRPRDVLGLSLTASTDGQLRLGTIASASPLTASPVATRDVLLSINNTPCRGLTPDQALANLLAAVTSVNADCTTIRLRNEGGNAQRVATTVEKPHKEALLGVTFGLNEHASVAITSVKANHVLASSLLNPGDRLISVNEHDCTNVAPPTAVDVTQWIREAPRFVTIVTEPATSTAVVIAVGDAALADCGLAAHGSVSSQPEEERMSDENKKRIVCRIIFGGILIILLAVLATVSESPSLSEEGAATDDLIFSETPDGRFFSLCDQVKVLKVDGTPLRDTSSRAVNVGAPDCSSPSFIQTFSGTTWYTFRVADNQSVAVSTCHDSPVDTVLSVYGGSCTSLFCLGFNDDFGFNNCGESSQVWIPPGEGRDIFVQVSGYGGIEGDFGIKVETVQSRFDSNCECNNEPDLPLAPTLPPAPSPAPVVVSTPPPAP